MLKPKIFLPLFTFGFSALSYAQINLKGPAQQLASEIKGIFPFVAVVIFIVVVFVNLGHFVKDNGDWRKGVTNIVLFAAILGAVVGLINYVGSINLN
ncbi:hypothetical protein P0M11_12700 [Kaistella sp. PBT33-4]|uniref:hypothetical protein n=1 Tax=Kaistella sp. PBT33-4 TaxID=3032000 RepID=UPI0023D815E3|nr:hypothetical protein [Kaistella sp. PBT33-4]MDF0720859.1 hypothetical protein [Kaistella sp. PBT33-4]